MAVITLSADSVPIYGGTSTSLTLRVFTTQDWTTYEGVTLTQGDGVTLPWYTDYVCPVTAGVAARPSVTLYSTTDRLEPYLDPRWTALWLDNGNVIGEYFKGYIVGPSPTTKTKAELDAYQPSQNLNQRWNFSGYTTTQVDALFARLSSLVGLTAVNFLPKVTSTSPLLLGNSQISDDGTIIDLDIIHPSAGTPRVTFGSLTDNDPALLANGARLEAVTALTAGRSQFVSNGVPIYEGQLASGTINATLTTQQTLMGAGASTAYITKVILYGNTNNLGSWAGNYLLGINGGNEFAAGTNASLVLGTVSDLNYVVLIPLAGARGVGGALTPFTFRSTSATGAAGTINYKLMGFYI